MIRTFHFSSKIVGGYQVKVNLDEVDSIADIEQICTAKLLQILTDNNSDLLSKIEERKFHIHGATIEEIKNPRNKRMFYLCDTCASKE